MTLEFRDVKENYIKQWHNWESEVPQAGDIVILHFGDYNEEAVEYVVVKRVISGTHSNKVIIVVNLIKD